MHQQKQIYVFLFVVFFAFVGVGIAYPILAPLFFHPTQSGLISTHWSSSIRSILFGITLGAYPFGQFFGSPILGSLSDQYGRKKLLLISITGAFIGNALTAVAIGSATLWLLIFCRFLTGFLEGNIAIAYAGITDLATDKQKGLGAVAAMSSLGYTAGPLLGGLLADKSLVSWFNYSLPFYTAAVIAIVLVGIIIFYLQESLAPAHINKKSLSRQFNLVGRFVEISKNKNLKWLLISSFFIFVAIDIYYEFFPAVLVAHWQMTSAIIAVYTAILGVSLAIGNFWLAPRMSRMISLKMNLCLFTIISTLLLLLLILTQETTTLFLQCIIIGLAIGSQGNVTMTLLYTNAAKNQQGEVMGMRWGLRMLGDSLICIVGGLLFVISSIAPILLAIIFALLGLGIYYFTMKE